MKTVIIMLENCFLRLESQLVVGPNPISKSKLNSFNRISGPTGIRTPVQSSGGYDDIQATSWVLELLSHQRWFNSSFFRTHACGQT